MKFKKSISCFVIGFTIFLGIGFSEEFVNLKDFPGYSVTDSLSVDETHKVLEIRSKKEKSIKLLYVNINEDSDYKVIFTSRTKHDWCVSSIFTINI